MAFGGMYVIFLCLLNMTVCKLTYIFKKKPLDVQEPMPVEATAYTDVLALMLMASFPIRPDTTLEEICYLKMYRTESHPNANDEPKGTHSQRPVSSATSMDVVQSELRSGQDQVQQTRHLPAKIELVQQYRFDGKVDCIDLSPKSDAVISLRTGQSLKCGLGPGMGWSRNDRGLKLSLSSQDVQRWEFAAKILKKLDTFSFDVENGNREWSGTRVEGYEAGVSLASPNITSEGRITQNIRWTVEGIIDTVMEERALLLGTSSHRLYMAVYTSRPGILHFLRC